MSNTPSSPVPAVVTTKTPSPNAVSPVAAPPASVPPAVAPEKLNAAQRFLLREKMIAAKRKAKS